MPEYTAATHKVDELRAKFDAETKRSENDFHTKYEDFLEGQRSFAPSILKKRQAELQEILDKNIAFKKEADRLIEEVEKQVYAPVHAKLKKAIAKMAQESGYAFVLNADNNALPYVNNMVGEDISDFEIITINEDDILNKKYKIKRKSKRKTPQTTIKTI